MKVRRQLRRLDTIEKTKSQPQMDAGRTQMKN
jgi:hypothetical protein